MLIGYARVSTEDQNFDLQLDALNKIGCNKIFSEKISGAKTDRAELNNALDYMREGDTLVVWKLDRLGRSLKFLIDTVNLLHDKKMHFKSLQEGFDTSTSGGKLIFHIFGSLSEFEREIIRERTNAGLKAARARGRLGGRPSKLNQTQLTQLKKLYADKSNEIKDICKLFSISRQSLYRLIKN
jgi:DNA invertase Pin-like site-specific DNA recombinase